MVTVGITCNLKRTDSPAALRGLIAGVERAGGRVVVDGEVGLASGRSAECSSLDQLAADLDFVIALGGDGTLLRTARMLAGSGCPILGVNLGRLGFMTELEVSELEKQLPLIIQGQYQIEERMMLDVAVTSVDGEAARYVALNDAVIHKGVPSRTIHISLSVSGIEAASYPADGVIVASPTGSTAYSLSAGGPVVYPGLDLFVVTPICPHALHVRSMVVAGDASVGVSVHSDDAEHLLTVDGQEHHLLRDNESVVIRRAATVTRLIRSAQYNFFQSVRRKLAEPER